MIRRVSRQVNVGNIKIGGDAPVAIQSMLNALASDFEGNLNFGKIISAAEDMGAEHLLVEQDDCYGEDPFECLKRSYLYLRAMGLE